MKFISSLITLLLTIIVNGQTVTYDILRFTPPEKWVRTESKNAIVYTSTNKTTKTWCQLIINKSIPGQENAETDFSSEWKSLVSPLGVAGQPENIQISTTGGWKIKTGTGNFVFNNNPAISSLTTYSGNGICVSFQINTNSESYLPELKQFMETLKIMPVSKPDPGKTTPGKMTSASGRYQYASTNFDDGWVAEEMQDWVQVTKGTNRVLLHYANPVTNEYIPDRDKSVNVAWNNLVAPRYSNLKNYFVFNNAMDPESPQFISGEMKENGSGKTVYVVLFHRGKSGWLEFICPDKASFINSYGIDQSTLTFYQDMDSWNPLKKMASYNKFAIAATDIPGTWTNDFTGIQQYVYTYTGQSAGMSTYQSKQVFELAASKTYKWTLSVASGMVGNIKGKTTKTNGKYTLTSSWQIRFSDISGKPGLYDAYFSCIKGARILWLSNTAYPGFDAYGKKE